MKLTKREIILSIIALVLVVLAIIGTALGSVEEKEETIVFVGYEYQNISKFKEMNFNYEYRENNYIVYMPFTQLKGTLYLHLLGVKDFEKKYGWIYNSSYIFVDSIEGEYPKNDKEILFPDFYKEGYEIGDKILLNTNFYKKDFVSGLTKEPFTITYDQELCGINEELYVEYKEQEVLEEYTIVGFYKANNIQYYLDFLPYHEIDNLGETFEIPVFTKADNIISVNSKVDFISTIKYKRFSQKKYDEDLSKLVVFHNKYTNDQFSTACNKNKRTFRYNIEDGAYSTY